MSDSFPRRRSRLSRSEFPRAFRGFKGILSSVFSGEYNRGNFQAICAKRLGSTEPRKEFTIGRSDALGGARLSRSLPDARLPRRRAHTGALRRARRRPRRHALRAHKRDASLPLVALPARPFERALRLLARLATHPAAEMGEGAVRR